jgi:hypothetical protein
MVQGADLLILNLNWQDNIKRCQGVSLAPKNLFKIFYFSFCFYFSDQDRSHDGCDAKNDSRFHKKDEFRFSSFKKY